MKSSKHNVAMKKMFVTKERQNAKISVDNELSEISANIDKLGLTKKAKDFIGMDFSCAELFVPKGYYCYDKKGYCPFWDIALKKEEQSNGYCWLLSKGDWETNSIFNLLWDQCKECGINELT